MYKSFNIVNSFFNNLLAVVSPRRSCSDVHEVGLLCDREDEDVVVVEIEALTPWSSSDRKQFLHRDDHPTCAWNPCGHSIMVIALRPSIRCGAAYFEKYPDLFSFHRTVGLLIYHVNVSSDLWKRKCFLSSSLAFVKKYALRPRGRETVFSNFLLLGH